MIPKQIFQLTTSNLRLDDQIYSNIEFLKQNNPTWKYELLDESKQVVFLTKFASHFLPIYHSFGRGYDVAKMDFFRYVLMYECGGVYLDVKSTFTQSLENLSAKSDSFVVSHWPNAKESRYRNWGRHPELSDRGELINGVIIAEPRHPILFDVIKAVVTNIEQYNPFKNGVGGPAVLRLTGPVAYTLAIDQSVFRKSLTKTDFFSHGYKVSIYDNDSEHISMSKLHYGRRLNPIIKRKPLESVAVIVFFFCKHKIWLFVTKKISGLKQRLC